MMQLAPSAGAWDKSLRPEYHHDNQNNAENQVTNIAKGKAGDNLHNCVVNRIDNGSWVRRQCVQLRQNKLVDCIDNERTNNHPRNTANTTDDNHCEINYRVTKAEVIW